MDSGSCSNRSGGALELAYPNGKADETRMHLQSRPLGFARQQPAQQSAHGSPSRDRICALLLPFRESVDRAAGAAQYEGYALLRLAPRGRGGVAVSAPTVMWPQRAKSFGQVATCDYPELSRQRTRSRCCRACGHNLRVVVDALVLVLRAVDNVREQKHASLLGALCYGRWDCS